MTEKILVVDDVEINRELLASILEKYFPIIQAKDGLEAIKIIEEEEEGLVAILLDLVMPNADGFQVMEYMEDNNLMSKIPVIIISGENSVETERKCFEAGAADYIHKPFDNIIVSSRVSNAIDFYAYKKSLEEQVMTQTKTLKYQNQLLYEQSMELRKNNEKIIDLLGTVVESRNLESGEHIKRVKGFTKILAKQVAIDYPEYELTEDKIDVIVVASALHDIGKIAIKDSVLLKPARLTPEEFDYIKTHTIIGCEILAQMEDAWDERYRRESYEICRYHHERYDGNGYPSGLSGDQIPISAQIVSVADVYDALVSERVYKKAIEKNKAFEMIIGGQCGVFSPKLMECFKKVRGEMEQLVDIQHGMEDDR